MSGCSWWLRAGIVGGGRTSLLRPAEDECAAGRSGRIPTICTQLSIPASLRGVTHHEQGVSASPEARTTRACPTAKGVGQEVRSLGQRPIQRSSNSGKDSQSVGQLDWAHMPGPRALRAQIHNLRVHIAHPINHLVTEFWVVLQVRKSLRPQRGCPLEVADLFCSQSSEATSPSFVRGF